MFAVSPTDIDWFRFIRSEGITNNVNFWTPTDWKISRLSEGDRLYFMLKSPTRKGRRTLALPKAHVLY